MRCVEGMEMIVKILAAIAAVLCAANCVLFTYCGFVALQQGNMENVAKSVMLVAVLTFAEVLCILELTRD